MATNATEHRLTPYEFIEEYTDAIQYVPVCKSPFGRQQFQVTTCLGTYIKTHLLDAIKEAAKEMEVELELPSNYTD